MRLNIAFLTLLTVATLAAGLELKELPPAREGDVVARAFVLGAAPILIAAITLLTRIVSRVDAARRFGREARS